MLNPRDEAVLDQFARITGIGYPTSIEKVLPEGGLFQGKVGGFLAIGAILALGAYGKWRADEKAKQEQEEELYQEWRRSRGGGL